MERLVQQYKESVAKAISPQKRKLLQEEDDELQDRQRKEKAARDYHSQCEFWLAMDREECEFVFEWQVC